MGFTKKEQNQADEMSDLAKNFEEGLKEKLDAMSPAQLKEFIGQVTLNELENKKNQKEDQDRNEKKAAYDSANAQYKEATKANKDKIAYAKYLVDGTGQ